MLPLHERQTILPHVSFPRFYLLVKIGRRICVDWGPSEWLVNTRRYQLTKISFDCLLTEVGNSRLSRVTPFWNVYRLGVHRNRNNIAVIIGLIDSITKLHPGPTYLTEFLLSHLTPHYQHHRASSPSSYFREITGIAESRVLEISGAMNVLSIQA